MPNKNLILALGKVIIAAAWADGHLSHEETNSLKDLILRLSHASDNTEVLTAREWAILEMYMESPVDEVERTRLLEDLNAAAWTTEAKQLAVAGLEDLIQADGLVTDEERAVMEEVKAAIDQMTPGVIGQLGRLVQGALQRRSEAVASAPNREEHLDDFIRNKVFYQVRQRLGLDDAALDIPEAELRKLSLAGGLMARVAHVDRQVTDDEFELMVDVLQHHWGLSQPMAACVAETAVSEVAADLDFYRLTRQFFEKTTEEERVRFLDILFDIADADGFISHDEIEEVRRIGQSLHLTRKTINQAKAKIPRERRAA